MDAISLQEVALTFLKSLASSSRSSRPRTRRTASCREGWTPEAARRVGRLNVVTPRGDGWERSAVRWE
ncbi:hypothetical protein E2C01_068944 [Portunus trituberculatus]|uniref:Uncharacterized protein n=1 Tax=Portunus trituberculatus TaxID=210409 RepID=A0A5B7HQ66_PORTR|nr:hypothetical protein [Portunus trituberculatus]